MESDSRENVRTIPGIRKAVLRDIERSNSFFTSKVEPVLRTRHQIYEADRAYYNKRFSRTAGQSDFVSFDFWSVVQWAIPVIMNSFFGGSNEAVVIVGRNEEDVQRAELLKALISFQLMTQNKGFLVLWDWFTDAFQYNLGAVKIWWERVVDWDEAKIEYCDMSRLIMLEEEPMCEVYYASAPDSFGQCQVAYRVGRLRSNKPIIEPVRVTDLRWSPEAKSLKDANFVAHRQMVTADHLRKQAKAGVYDARAVERAIESAGSDLMYGQFEVELNDEIDQRPNDEGGARALYELYECYVKLDINGDGMLEDALISVVGDEIIRVTENSYGRVPIFTLSPVRDPFKVLANLSLAEIVGEIQAIKTGLIRQMLINTVNTNYQKWFIDEQGVNQNDIQDNRQFIRIKTGNPRDKVEPWPQQGIAPWTMNMLESLEGALEQTTGRTRYNQGMDAQSLNKTATGISLLQQASAQRIDYIVRVFAETGVSEALRFLVELNQKYIDQPTVIRLKNQMLQITPDDLKGEYDIDVNTEAGVGKKQQTIQNLQFYLSAIAPTGMKIGAITPGEWAKAAQKLLTESGIRNPQDYVLDPEIIKQQFFMALQAQMQVQEQAQIQEAANAGFQAGKSDGNVARVMQNAMIGGG